MSDPNLENNSLENLETNELFARGKEIMQIINTCTEDSVPANLMQELTQLEDIVHKRQSDQRKAVKAQAVEALNATPTDYVFSRYLKKTLDTIRKSDSWFFEVISRLDKENSSAWHAMYTEYFHKVLLQPTNTYKSINVINFVADNLRFIPESLHIPIIRDLCRITGPGIESDNDIFYKLIQDKLKGILQDNAGTAEIIAQEIQNVAETYSDIYKPEANLSIDNSGIDNERIFRFYNYHLERIKSIRQTITSADNQIKQLTYLSYHLIRVRKPLEFLAEG